MTKPEDTTKAAGGSPVERLVRRLCPEGDKAFWAKCANCGHCFPAAYYPMPLHRMGAVLKDVACPRGCAGSPLIAKQDDGTLLEVPWGSE